MNKKMAKIGHSLSVADMKKTMGGLIPKSGCIPLGQPCGGGGCDDPPPVCCGEGAYCTGYNGLISLEGTCVIDK